MNALIERRDAGVIREIARNLIVTAEHLTIGDGLLTLVRADFLVKLRDYFGDDGIADVWVVIDGPGLRAAKHPAGLRALDDELKAIRELALAGPPVTTLRPEAARPTAVPALPDGKTRRAEVVEERAANLAAHAAKQKARPAADGAMSRAEFHAALKHLGMTCAQLAAAIGVSVWTVRKWSRGALAPSPERAAAIRRLVGKQMVAG